METISRRQSFSEKGINVMSEKEKIIVFSSREICYQSSSFFANQMADAFEDLGFDVQVCEFDEHDDLDAVFQPLYGQKYRLLLDFNSTITRMVEEDGTPVLDKLDGPFFDYILDHPLFHYNCLNADLKNLNGIFLDEAQEAYVKRYYPRVKKTLTMPLGATEAVTGGKKTETDTVLFMGTYDRPDKIYEMVELSPEPLRSYMKELVRAKIPVRLVGEGWEKYESCNEAYVTREKAVVFGLSFEKIAHADVLLNVSPFFNHGAHDRIFAGMANHCTVLTDQNPYLKRILKDGEQVCMYSLKDIRTLSDYAAELLTNHALCRDIQNNAYVEFKQKYTWEEKAKQLLACTLR